MITGVVKSDEGRIRLKVKGLRGREQEVEAVIDTGYTASLTLPNAVVAALGLRWRSMDRFTLADGMEIDTQKIDEAILALLCLGLHDGARAWKGFDWDAMDRLYQQGYITDPRGKAKSVVFTEEGLERAQRLLTQLFGKPGEPAAAADRGRHLGSARDEGAVGGPGG
jgi:uncharacterized protein DUF6429